MHAITIYLKGKVQHVGLRPSFELLANRYHLIGFIKNHEKDQVIIHLVEPSVDYKKLIDELMKINPRIKIDSLSIEDSIEKKPYDSFTIF